MGIIFEAIFEFVFGVVFFYIGEVTLTLVTLGHHKLQLDPFNSGDSNINRGKSITIGFLVCIGLILGLVALFDAIR